MQSHDDRDRHTVHRLEAFSDIVIGFCLAQLGLNLVLPKGSNDVTGVWASTTFFITAFIFIALLWWLHHRTFSTYFVLATPMIIMNFGVLCGLILTLYFFESVVHVATSGQNPIIFFKLFAVSFALVYSLMGGTLLIGLLLRRPELAPSDVRWAISQLTTIAITVLFFVGAAITAAHPARIIYAAAIAYALVFLVRRTLLRRWLRQAIS